MQNSYSEDKIFALVQIGKQTTDMDHLLNKQLNNGTSIPDEKGTVNAIPLTAIILALVASCNSGKSIFPLFWFSLES